ncbi:MAG: hypothetical protein L6V93_01920 [Clostridiales bacterium]|nr:MAG: hypothetical protein L6V93_01920 [Clostridiales bacterium]
MADNRALIENKVYGFDYRNMSNLIGQTVKFYYKDDAFKTIVYAEPDGSDTVTVLNANDIISCDGKKYTYEGTSGKERYISLESSHFIMFNGRVASDITNDKYIPEFGCVKLIDNNGDGKYDVVIITSYENYVIKKVLTLTRKFCMTDTIIKNHCVLMKKRILTLILQLQTERKYLLQQFPNGRLYQLR